jgi:MarR family transcriptional regulator, organic hydroperoxide resistance regulator
MADRTSLKEDRPRTGRVSPGALETSRLLLEFLHAAYATRNMDRAPADGDGSDGRSGSEAARPHGTAEDVSAHAVRVAIHVYQHGERTVGQVAAGLGISYGWASRVVEEAEASGYLIRERDQDDRRVVRVRLNPERLEEVERAYEWRGRAVQEALEPLTEAEGEAVRLFLRRVTELMLRRGPEQP